MNLSELKPDEKVKVSIAGSVIEFDPKDDVTEKLSAELSSRGIDSFTILVDGVEITDTDDLPKTFGDAETIEVQRYVKPGA